MSGLPFEWGATPEEIERRYPADEILADPVITLTRAVSVAAPATLSYRWLCQVAVAPYSYDLIDNLGKRSPRELTPGADQIDIGDLMMIFEVTDVSPGNHWTGRISPRARRVFGDLTTTYAAEPVSETESRMVCRLVCRRDGLFNAVRAWGLAWGDLVMMRKQLLNFKELAERDAAR